MSQPMLEREKFPTAIGKLRSAGRAKVRGQIMSRMSCGTGMPSESQHSSQSFSKFR